METVSIKVSIYLNLIILPLIKLYSPDTKLKNRTKISVKRKFRKFQEFDVIFKNWQNSRKNFSNDFLSTYVLLIQSRIFGQKFQSIENFENSRNLTSFPRIGKILGKVSRTTSYQLMFSWYKIQISDNKFLTKFSTLY